MKKKVVSILLAAMMVATLTTGCGDTQEASAPNAGTQEAAPEAEPEVEEPEEEEAVVDEEEVVDEEAADEEVESEDFTLLDVTNEMIEVGVYAVAEDQTELVFSMFTEPSGTPMASLFLFTADGSGDVICGPYTGESETDEDGISWTLLTVEDVYTGQVFELGFGESEEGEIYIFDTEDGTPYEGEYLSADDTIDYMGAAVALLAQ